MKKDPLIEIKPAWGPFSFNLNELWRRWNNRSRGPAGDVAERFLTIFEAHGIATAQIPRFLPSLNLSELKSPESLLPSLTPSVLDETASLFGIQRAWLENTTDRIYRTWTCYKQPHALFEQPLRGKLPFSPVRALKSAKPLNFRNNSEQSLVLVIAEQLAKVEDVDQIWDIERYHICGDSWNWSHPPCRIQLKAMARIIDQILKERVPVFSVKPKHLAAIREGRLVPRKFLNQCLLTNPSLDDYACSHDENAHARETEELPDVHEYIRSHDLENVGAWCKAV